MKLPPPGWARLQAVGGVGLRARHGRGDRSWSTKRAQTVPSPRGYLSAAPAARRVAPRLFHLIFTSLIGTATGLRMPTAGPEPRAARPDLLNE